ncbi:hypothetical protein BDQ17DRAFT_1328894 [Cyathus striatus]|nr:hypothetical protein BDQ17DRAFT_1328894 [Cyathus striatus]
MQFTNLSAIVLISTVISAFAQQTTTQRLVFDTRFDNRNGQVRNSICDRLATANPTYGSFLTFPNIGSSFSIQSYNSPSCGSCWELTHTRNGESNTTFYTAIDSINEGFGMSLMGATNLTGYDRAHFPAYVPVQAREVDRSNCFRVNA